MNADQKNVIVLDLTHAGIPLAKELAKAGHRVSAIDVYNTVAEDALSDLHHVHNIQILPSDATFSKDTILISPVHLDPGHPILKQARIQGNRIITHHKATGDVILERSLLSGTLVIEITGTRGKTSTASILADILSRNADVVLHTSRGLEHWSAGIASTIHKGLSIAPGSILSAIQITAEAGLTPEIFIIETSIGGTGCADIGVITSFAEDYPIAAQTSLASDAKLQIITNARKDSKLILNSSCEKAISCAVQQKLSFTTFSDEGIKADVRFTFSSDTDKTSFSIKTEDLFGEGVSCGGYNISSYSMAMAASFAVALSLNVSVDTIVQVLSGFTGLEGRMKVSKLDDRVIVDNSNSGLSVDLVCDCLDYSLSIKQDKHIFMILGEQARQVCEGLDPEKVKEFLKDRHEELSGICLIGERMRDTGIEKMFNGPVYLEDDMDRAMSHAYNNTQSGDLIISSVKSFR